MTDMQVSASERPTSVSIIGSFKQHHEEVQIAVISFSRVGLSVLSPQGKRIIKPRVPFVRFDTDPKEWSDAMVQVVALHRILRASFVYVVAPSGYVGRTTSYEIGRVLQSGVPIYFSNKPDDLPLHVPENHIGPVTQIAKQIESGTFFPQALYAREDDNVSRLERDIMVGEYRDI